MYGNGPVFKAEGTSFRDQPYAEQLPQGLWTTGLCDCHEDAHICTYQNVYLFVFWLIFLLLCCLKIKWFLFWIHKGVQTAIMPCVSFAQNVEIVNRGTIRKKKPIINIFVIALICFYKNLKIWIWGKCSLYERWFDSSSVRLCGLQLALRFSKPV